MKRQTMKKLLFFIALVVLFSCKDKTCYECKTYTFTNADVLVDVETEVVCTDDELEILKYQTDRYVFEETYYSTCECKEQ